ncbi:AAA family ATPase [Mucilaginibacter sp. AK015]|uniref:AAA family ATPase n=1 Tax=Mucilaginibacter sp. AK015 TaxID=2723072 RepID=UPI0016212411|nr:AAA family ATPase [Mucilaginibacter sp. AK015]MBB5395273.1 putative ATPase [Mucilaginibacter sp. AK015]
MLSKLTVGHYKAFENASINLRPITILLGANSVGKSSIIQLFLMLQQTGRAGFKSYKSALKLYGGYVNLGDPQNLFRRRDTSKTIDFTFEVQSAVIKEFLKNDYFESFRRSYVDLPLYIPIKGLAEIRKKPIDNREDFSKFLDTISSVLNKSTIQETFRRDIHWFLRQRYSHSLPNFSKEGKKELLLMYDFLNELAKGIKSDLFLMVYKLKINEVNTLEIAHFEIKNADATILSISNSDTFSVASNFININQDIIEQIKKFFQPSNTIFTSFENVVNEDGYADTLPLASCILYFFSYFQNELQKEFAENNINYVSPLRAHPKRYYMLDKAKLNLTLDTLDGDAITEVLKDNIQVTKNVNMWLKNFGVQVDVQGFKEVIHHLVVKQNNIDLDITDVGFGISQILPVIIQGFLSGKNSTTIIEQPEIHLHPKMQADLADLFIDIVKATNGKKLIIETHSEYLLKRLRRRISEGTISADDVSICFFTPQSKDNGAVIENLKIENKGFFEWPLDFYGGEILKDTTEYLKNQD